MEKSKDDIDAYQKIVKMRLQMKKKEEKRSLVMSTKSTKPSTTSKSTTFARELLPMHLHLSSKPTLDSHKLEEISKERYTLRFILIIY